VDQWSLDVFSALKGWPLGREGEWSRWEPGYLLLEIGSFGGKPIDPAVLYSADEELTVAFGCWECHLPLQRTTAMEAAEEAIAFAEGWTSGKSQTLVFKDSAGKWCGTIPVSAGDLNEQIAHSQDWLAHLGPTEAELRTALRSKWRTIKFVDGRLIE
jgi:hypothetical protein